MTKQTSETLYSAAVDADEEFQAHLERQFGVSRAPDMRYRSAAHDATTKAAREKFHTAMSKLRGER